MHICAIFGKTKLSLTNGANFPGLVLMAGQKIADGQQGTIRVPLALQTDMCLMTGMIKATGEQTQFVSFDQF